MNSKSSDPTPSPRKYNVNVTFLSCPVFLYFLKNKTNSEKTSGIIPSAYYDYGDHSVYTYYCIAFQYVSILILLIINTSNSCFPILVNWHLNEKIASIQCGPECTGIITDHQNVYACGLNKCNKLGLNRPSLFKLKVNIIM